MKYLKNGKFYDTDESRCLFILDKMNITERLFRTAWGDYFIHTQFKKLNLQKIDLLRRDDAFNWLQEHCEEEACEREFPHIYNLGKESNW
jgi:hypothetical protein